jgi:hypothetical protein
MKRRLLSLRGRIALPIGVVVCAIACVTCATVRVVDRLSPGAPRGYVEFYGEYYNLANLVPVDVFERIGEELVHVGKVTRGPMSGFQSRVALRIAASPGKHTYGMSRDSMVDLEVVEHMLVPIRLHAERISSWWKLGNQITYMVTWTVEPARTYP